MNKEEFVAKFFPEVEPGLEPLGNKILVQLILVKKKVGSIILANDTQDFNKEATVVARIIRAGQIAFRDRNTGSLWKEGAWANIGDVVLVPRYGGMNRVEFSINDEESVIFCTFNDYDIVDKVTCQFEKYTQLL